LNDRRALPVYNDAVVEVIGVRGYLSMTNGQNQEPSETKKKPRVTLRDLTVSKNAHVTGGASGHAHRTLRDLKWSKDAGVSRDSGR